MLKRNPIAAAEADLQAQLRKAGLKIVKPAHGIEPQGRQERVEELLLADPQALAPAPPEEGALGGAHALKRTPPTYSPSASVRASGTATPLQAST